MAHACRILQDSVTNRGHRLTTFILTIPRIILAEWNTHCMFARNSASSRAIPVKKMIEMVINDPYIPSAWGKNQKGMSAAEDILGEDAVMCETEWLHARDNAIYQAQKLMELGVHKQLTNRLLEPFMWHTIINSATEYSNFLGLRDDPHAHPDIQIPARSIKELLLSHTPTLIKEGDWHLPLTTDAEWVVAHERSQELEELIKISTGRVARVSYLTHDGKRDPAADIALHDQLLSNGHMSPLEHQARPMNDEEYDVLFKQHQLVWSLTLKRFVKQWTFDGEEPLFTHFCAKYQGWVQYRKQIPHEEDYGNYLKNQRVA